MSTGASIEVVTWKELATGASFTGETVMATVAVFEAATSSLARKVNESVPWKSVPGV